MTALDHCVIAVSDWERANAFYVDVVGVELVDRGDGGFHYALGGGQRLNVHGPGADGEINARFPVAPGGSDLCFVWDGPIEQAAAHLAARSVEIEQGPVSRHGARGPATSVYFRDPDGSLLEFISYG